MVFGALGILASLVIMLCYGGLASLIGFTDHSDGKSIAIPILGVIFGIGALLVFVLSRPGTAGVSLWHGIRRVLALGAAE